MEAGYQSTYDIGLGEHEGKLSFYFAFVRALGRPDSSRPNIPSVSQGISLQVSLDRRDKELNSPRVASPVMFKI